MENLKNNIETAIYAYNPDEFVPVFREGRLDNKGEFIAYKAEQFAEQLGHLASRTLEATRIAGSVLLEHIAAETE